MAQTTIKNASGANVTAALVTNTGSAADADSLPVAFSTEGKALLQALVDISRMPRYPVAPTLGGDLSKRIQGDAGSAQAIYELRLVVNAETSNAAMQALRLVGDDCRILGRRSARSWRVDGPVTNVYFVFVGTATATATACVAPGASESDFTSAMRRLDFVEGDNVEGLDVETLDVLAADGTTAARYLTATVEGLTDDA